MLKPRILVTGATGKTGSVVVAELLQAGYPVRAMVHRHDGRSVRLKAQGAEITVADMSDVDHVADALKDVQRAYYCPPFDPYQPIKRERRRVCYRNSHSLAASHSA
jgi:NAD(P)H dehydrogenase (quinone)